jgi:transposase
MSLEKLLCTLLLQILPTIRSERLFKEQLNYYLLFHWFVGLSMNDKVWNYSALFQHHERFLATDLAAAFSRRIKDQDSQAGLFRTSLSPWTAPSLRPGLP